MSVPMGDGFFLAAVRKSQNEYEFYFVNNTDGVVTELVLTRVSYNWGDMGNSQSVNRRLGPLPARRFVLAWTDDSDAAELQTDLNFSADGKALSFEVPRLYKLTGGVDVPVLGKALYALAPS